jgi:hypothetical protein
VALTALAALAALAADSIGVVLNASSWGQNAVANAMPVESVRRLGMDAALIDKT